MASTPNYRCLLGAQGWDHAAWLGNFYPEDMPAEWRLSFYNTEFECVYLPRALWRNTEVASCVSWERDTLAGFRFLLEPSDTALTAADTARLAALGEKAFLLADDAPQLIWLPSKLDLKQLAQDLQSATQTPLYLLSARADLAQLQQVRTLLQVMGF